MIFRLLNGQGIAGLAAAIALLGLLLFQTVETHRWRGRAASEEQLYRAEQAAGAQTVANYRAAADTARAVDRAEAARVVAAQQAINERTSDDYQARLAAARAAAVRLGARGVQHASAPTAADRGRGGTAPVPAAGAAPGGTAGAPAQDGFPVADRLTATEQAIQLDELIKWVRRQAAVRTPGQPLHP